MPTLLAATAVEQEIQFFRRKAGRISCPRWIVSLGAPGQALCNDQLPRPAEDGCGPGLSKTDSRLAGILDSIRAVRGIQFLGRVQTGATRLVSRARQVLAAFVLDSSGCSLIQDGGDSPGITLSTSDRNRI